MRRAPETRDATKDGMARGDGQLGSIHSRYMIDPLTFFVEQQRGSGNPFFSEHRLAEAAQRGEVDGLIMTLKAAGRDPRNNEAWQLFDGVHDMMDFDTYMLALQFNLLSNDNAIERRHDETGHVFGTYTDREWVWQLLQDARLRVDAQIHDAMIANRSWFARAIPRVVGWGMRAATAVVDFAGAIYDLGEGILNVLFNFSGDDSAGARFLWAFQNDDWTRRTRDVMNAMTWQWYLDHTGLVLATDAHDQGWRRCFEGNIFQQVANTTGIGTGYTSWGQISNAVAHTLGFIAGSALTFGLGVKPALKAKTATVGTQALKKYKAGKAFTTGLGPQGLARVQSLWYFTGIASGTMADSVQLGMANGLCYSDLNAGAIIANASLRALSSWAIAQGLGMAMGFSPIDKKIGMGVGRAAPAAQAAGQVATATGMRAAGHVMFRAGRHMLKEGLENVFQEMGEGIINAAFGGKWKEQSGQQLSIENLVDAFLIGVLATVANGAMPSVNNVLRHMLNPTAVQIQLNGQITKAGFWQGINIGWAQQQMNQLQIGMNDTTKSLDQRAALAFQMNTILSTAGTLFSEFGPDRAVKANALLENVAQLQEAERVNAQKTNIQYANDLFTEFMKTAEFTSARYMTAKMAETAKKAAAKQAAKLKKGQTNKIESVITTETVSSDPVNPGTTESVDTLKGRLAQLGCTMLVGTDGVSIVKSDDVVFVPNHLLENGDLQTIIKGLAFESAVTAVKRVLNASQKKNLAVTYEKVVGEPGTTEQHIAALLFDSSFYTYMMFLSTEKGAKNPSLQVLATLDQVISHAHAQDDVTGTLHIAAYKALMQKCQQTMRTGLATYLTQHERIDMGAIDGGVLTPEMKREITNNPNVQFSTGLDAVRVDAAKVGPMTQETLQRFEQLLTQISEKNLPSAIRDRVRTLFKSVNVNDRISAIAIVVEATRLDGTPGKVVYIPTNPGENVQTDAALASVNEWWGVSIDDLIHNTHDANDITDMAREYLANAGLDLSDDLQRMFAVREQMFRMSGYTLTVANNGQLMKVVDKSDFLKPELVDDKALRQLILDRTAAGQKRIRLSELTNIKLDPAMGDVMVAVGNLPPRVKAQWSFDQKAILINSTTIDGTANNIMHEITHAAQDLFGMSAVFVSGGATAMFTAMNNEARTSLMTYLETNFSDAFKFLRESGNRDDVGIAYFMLAGELQARAGPLTIFADMGFTWNADFSRLTSPDGKTSWDMTSQKGKARRGRPRMTQALTQQAGEGQTEAQLQDTVPTQVTHDTTLYTGQPVGRDLADTGEAGIWLSTSREDAAVYGGGQTRQFTLRQTANQVTVDARGRAYDSVRHQGAVGTDAIVSAIRQQNPNVQAIIFNNIVETEVHGPAATIWVASSQVLEGDVNQVATAEDPDGRITTRYISNRLAAQSNLKHFIRKGIPIQMDPGIANFVVATTESFAQLPEALRTLILNGELNKFNLLDFTARAARVNDFTWQTIAREVFGNTALAKATFAEFKSVLTNIRDLTALSWVVDDLTVRRTIPKMLEQLKGAQQRAQNDPAFAREWVKAVKHAETLRIRHDGKTSFVEANPDIRQLNNTMMYHFDGTLQGVRDVMNIGKFMDSRQNDVEGMGRTGWNFDDMRRSAEFDHIDTGTRDAIDTLDRQTMLDAIESALVTQVFEKAKARMTEAQMRAQATQLTEALNERVRQLHALSDTELRGRYLETLALEQATAVERANISVALVGEKRVTPVEGERTDKNRRDAIRNTARRVQQRIGGLKKSYDRLSADAKVLIDPGTFGLRKGVLDNMTAAQLDAALATLREASTFLTERIRLGEVARTQRQRTQDRMARQASKMTREGDGTEAKPMKDRPMREKVQIQHKTTIRHVDITFTGPDVATDTVRKLLETTWDKTKMTQVQGIQNTEQAVANGKTFFDQNATTLLNMTQEQVDQSVEFFLNARLEADTVEFARYQALMTYFLGYVLSARDLGTASWTLKPNQRQKIESKLQRIATNAGQALAVWKNVLGMINPIDTMKNSNMEIDGVELTQQEKEALFDAAVSMDVGKITEIQQMILQRVATDKIAKPSILRKIVTVRQMAMLSSPMTWLRNVMSNIMLKRLNKMSAKIGNAIFPSKHMEGQLRMDAAVTPEIQTFINEHFLDNGFFTQIVGSLRKYNPQTIPANMRDATGRASKEAIFANLVLRSMYQKHYNTTTFNTNWMRSVHQGLFKMLSDDKWVREASIRYFGQMLAEKGHNLENGITDVIMNDFSTAVGQGMADYMHTDNIFNKIETLLAERSETALFAYKMVVPFIAMGWSWFKAGVRFSPLGLGRSIFRMAKMEQAIRNNENKWAKGISDISPELMEFHIRRDMGAGIIGTAAWITGALLAGLGFIRLEQEDRGVPRLVIGNVRIDVSSIFGTSSLLAGAAMINVWSNQEEASWGGFVAGMDAGMDRLLDGFFLTNLLGMDNFVRGGNFSFTQNFLEQSVLSFMPNIMRWIAGATYAGTLQTDNFFHRAIARIPILNGIILERQINPYTGEEGDWWDAFNRTIPYFSVVARSQIESDAGALGLTRQQLRGNYTINDEPFRLNGRQTAELNRMYGQWNARDLQLFFNNQSTHTITRNNRQVQLRHNQMTEEERRQVANRIMTNNASHARIAAWLQAGNRFYGTQAQIAALRARGVTGAMFVGNRGFVAT